MIARRGRRTPPAQRRASRAGAGRETRRRAAATPGPRGVPNRALGLRRDDPGRAVTARATAEALLELESAARSAAAAAERALTYASVLDEALAVLVETRDPSPQPPRPDLAPDAALSPREREVLALVAEGRSNKAIAETLFISPNTVKTHVASLLAKLDAESRVQLAAYAARRRP